MFCYVHIPFCESKCSYCRFASFSDFDALKIQLYVDFLCKQITAYQSKYSDRLESIYFWWGTPSLLKTPQLQIIIETLRSKYQIVPTAEITLETTPQNISLQSLKDWQNMWVNRVSLWVQSLNNKTLQEIWRYTKEDIYKWLTNLSQSDIAHISIDFIIGLPYTQIGDVQKDIIQLIQRFPKIQHISVYMLEDYYYPKNWAWVSLSVEEITWEYLKVRNFLQTQWFNRYELSNFAREGYECKHNTAYWNHSPVVAFWLDAHGYIDGKRYAYPNTFKKYYTGDFAYQEELIPQDIALEKIMFWLRTTGVENIYLQNANQKKIQEFIDWGYLKRDGENIVLQDLGMGIMDYIIKEII